LIELPGRGFHRLSVALNFSFCFIPSNPVFADFELIAFRQMGLSYRDAARDGMTGERKGHVTFSR
jgi:hypothetical protein